MEHADLFDFLAQNKGLIYRLAKKLGLEKEVGVVEQEAATQFLFHSKSRWDPRRARLSTFLLREKGEVWKALWNMRPGSGTGGGDGGEEEIPAAETQEIEEWRKFEGNEAFEAMLDSVRDGTKSMAQAAGVCQRQARNRLNKQIRRFGGGDLFIT
ncbi:MAG: hypothetical protein ACYCTW_12945 [Sulfuricella sp.]